MNQYTTEVLTKRISVHRLETFLDRKTGLEACKACPSYGKDWSCPPGQPNPFTYFEPYHTAYLIAVKIHFDPEFRKTITDAEGMEWVRKNIYQKVQRELQITLLNMEQQNPNSLSISTCLLCETCARADNQPCRHPEKRRYSMTTLGFNMTKLLKQEFDTDLVWSGDNTLQETQVTVSALLCK